MSLDPRFFDTPRTATMKRFLAKHGPDGTGRIVGLSIEADGVFLYTRSAEWCDDSGSGTFRGDSETDAIAKVRNRALRGNGDAAAPCPAESWTGWNDPAPNTPAKALDELCDAYAAADSETPATAAPEAERTRYRLQSAPMIHTPGLVAWAINGAAFEADRPAMIKTIADVYGIPRDAAAALVTRAAPYTVTDDGQTVEFEF